MPNIISGVVYATVGIILIILTLALFVNMCRPARARCGIAMNKARQFFYILSGCAAMEMNGQSFTLESGKGVEVPPGVAHRFYNPFNAPVDFLVISHPSTRGDRVNL